jgi:hypothetical protein
MLRDFIEKGKPTVKQFYNVERHVLIPYRGVVNIPREYTDILDDEYIRRKMMHSMAETFEPLLVIRKDEYQDNPYCVRYVSDVYISFGGEENDVRRCD